MLDMKRSVYVVGGNTDVKSMFGSRGWDFAYNVGAADLVCFTGGPDVSPTLYDHPCHSTTFCSEERDKQEIAIFEAAMGKDTPMVGICRGGQFLNVMNGGKMYQDVTGHTTSHYMSVGNFESPDENIFVTSTHHQMMMPSAEGLVLATGPGCKASYWNDEAEAWAQKDLERGIEVVMYDRALCFQPHPEMYLITPTYTSMRNYFCKLISELMRD